MAVLLIVVERFRSKFDCGGDEGEFRKPAIFLSLYLSLFLTVGAVKEMKRKKWVFVKFGFGDSESNRWRCGMGHHSKLYVIQVDLLKADDNDVK